MMKINLICIGKLKEEYWRSACAEYSKRLQPFCKFTITELTEYRLPDNPSLSQIQSALDYEGDKLLTAANNSSLIALCVEGKPLSSEKLAEKINELAVRGSGSISFIIGSSYGLSNIIKQKAILKLSMSTMTFPHQLARVMLCEQIYRVFEVLNHGKYHK